MGKWNDFIIYSCTESGAWSEHCRGLITVTTSDAIPNVIDGKAALEARASQIKNSIAGLDSVCKIVVDCDLYYRKVSDVGLQFGPSFQGLYAVLAGPDQCIAKYQIPDTAASMPRNFETGHIIHPTALDPCFQSASLALKAADLEFPCIYVPTYVKSISISHGIPQDPGREFIAYTTARMSESGKESEARYIVTDACSQDDQPVIEIDGLISSALPGSERQKPTNTKRGLSSSMQHATCVGLLTTAQYPIVFPPSGQEPKAIEQNRNAERAAFYLAQAALAQLSSHEIQALGGHLKKLYNYLATRVAQALEGSIPYHTPDWIAASDVDKAEFLIEVESLSAHGKLVREIGKNLLAVFQGHVELLSIMRNDGLLERYYQDSISLYLTNVQCSRWIK